MSKIVECPCWSCRKESCIGCKHELQRNWVDVKENFPPAAEMDEFIENLYREAVDICYMENADGEQVLDQSFHGFPVGEFTQDDWLHFLDDHHSKGVGWIYENISPYEL